jgi:hypothetical protein
MKVKLKLIWQSLALTALAVTLTAFCAFADPPSDVDKVFNFETQEIIVDVLKPDLSTIEVLQENVRGLLIHIRRDFIMEIVHSAEDI